MPLSSSGLQVLGREELDLHRGCPGSWPARRHWAKYGQAPREMKVAARPLPLTLHGPSPRPGHPVGPRPP